MRRLAIAACGALLLAGLPAAARAGGAVQGRVTFDVPGMQLADLGPIVVYVADAEGGGADAAPPAKAVVHLTPSVHQKDARFSPGFLAIAAGQSVEMPNDDLIYHNVFSYSKPNDFDLGLYPAGESRSVAFAHAGVAKLYCSIHESMNGTIFVAPTRWFAVAASDGRYELRGVPPGRHRLRTWNEKLPDTEHVVDVPASGEATADLSLVPQP